MRLTFLSNSGLGLMILIFVDARVLLLIEDLQYEVTIFQEPIQNEDDIIKYCEESGLPVALDETIDKFQNDPLNMLEKYAHPGIVAIVSD